VKVFADGSAGGLTAAFFDRYLPADTRGVFTFPDETIHALLRRYHEQGWQLDIHAIGDAAIEQVLQGMEAADSAQHPFTGRRHRIEHCGFATRDQRRRMLARCILPVPQPVFIYEFGDTYITNLGRERSEYAYPMRTWLEEGQHPAASSDCPVSTVDPFVNLYTMLTRRTNRGTVLGIEEALTTEQAVHCQSWCGAYTQFAEASRGTLEPGMLADVAVLSRDIFAATPEDILRDTRCDLTLRRRRADLRPPRRARLMLRHAAQRIALAVPVMFGVLLVGFLLMQVVPTDPAVVRAGPTASAEVIEAIRRDLGLDQPLPVQFGLYVWRLAQGDLGVSIINNVPVSQELRATIGPTLELMLASLIWSIRSASRWARSRPIGAARCSTAW
jgi:hypothetical protein